MNNSTTPSGSSMPKVVAPNAEMLAIQVRDWFVDRCRESIAARGRFLVALAGGSTPKRLYELLAELPPLTIDWSRVILLWGDERDVAPEHADSNFRMVRVALLDRLVPPLPTVHPIPCGIMSPTAAAAEYEAMLRGYAVNEKLELDLVLLGLGDDAHTASLFPETKAVHEMQRWVVANEVPKLGTTRVTMTSPLLNAARHVAFLVAGENKRWALDKVHGDARDPNKYPAQLIVPSGRLCWFLDEAANQP